MMETSQIKIKPIQENDCAFWESIVKTLSAERLNAYRITAQSSTLDALIMKAWNMELCASLYPLFQMVEVCLRNSIHGAMRHHFKDESWFKNSRILAEREIKLVNHTIQNLKQLQRSSDASHLISELTFGFWTNLLHTQYERKIWHPLIKEIFPYIPKAHRRRAVIMRRFIEIRKLRNRVFHHQRIWNFPDLIERKKAIVETIDWIEPSVMKFLHEIDAFDRIYAQGTAHYKQKLLKIAKTI